MEAKKVIGQLEADIKHADRIGALFVFVGRKTAKDVLALLKEQDERIRQLEAANVTATGNGIAIGVVTGGLSIGR